MQIKLIDTCARRRRKAGNWPNPKEHRRLERAVGARELRTTTWHTTEH